MKPRNMNQITTKYVDQFIVRRLKDRGKKPGSTFSPATVNRDLRNLKLVFKAGQIVARGDDSKGKRDELIFVPGSLLDLLKPVWQNFGERPLECLKSRRTIYPPFMELQQSAGIDLPCEEDHEHTDACHVYGFHDFKRAFATNNASTLSPAQLQRLMKHSDFSTTQGYINYAKLMTEKPNVFVPDVLKQGPGGRTDSR